MCEKVRSGVRLPFEKIDPRSRSKCAVVPTVQKSFLRTLMGQNIEKRTRGKYLEGRVRSGFVYGERGEDIFERSGKVFGRESGFAYLEGLMKENGVGRSRRLHELRLRCSESHSKKSELYS
jgi:hypothetical protein